MEEEEKMPTPSTTQYHEEQRQSIMASGKRDFMEELRTKCFDRLKQQRSDLIYRRRFSA
jgi:hypothetical protein